MTLEACLSTIRSLLLDAGITTLTWDHPVSEPTHESTPAAKPLIDRLGQLYPDPPEIVDPQPPPLTIVRAVDETRGLDEVKVTAFDIPGVLLIEPDLFRDQRGLFCETFHARRYAEAGLPGPLFRITIHILSAGRCAGSTIRNRIAQGKLVMVTEGPSMMSWWISERGLLRSGMAWIRSVGGQLSAALCAAGLCAWFLRDQRTGLVAVQVHGLLFAERRAGNYLERSGPGHLLAGARHRSCRQGPSVWHPGTMEAQLPLYRPSTG